MIDWQHIDTASKDGRPVLLLARPRAHPPEPGSLVPTVGYFQRYPVERWKARDTDEDLFATHWAPLSGVEGQR